MSGEPPNLSQREITYWQSRTRYRSKPGPIPTLGDLQRCGGGWVWLWCERCQHHAPFALAAAVIRWGANASSNILRQRARCKACGNRGATTKHPSWTNMQVGFESFPVASSLTD